MRHPLPSYRWLAAVTSHVICESFPSPTRRTEVADRRSVDGRTMCARSRVQQIFTIGHYCLLRSTFFINEDEILFFLLVFHLVYLSPRRAAEFRCYSLKQKSRFRQGIHRYVVSVCFVVVESVAPVVPYVLHLETVIAVSPRFESP